MSCELYVCLVNINNKAFVTCFSNLEATKDFHLNATEPYLWFIFWNKVTASVISDLHSTVFFQNLTTSECTTNSRKSQKGSRQPFRYWISNFCTEPKLLSFTSLRNNEFFVIPKTVSGQEKWNFKFVSRNKYLIEAIKSVEEERAKRKSKAKIDQGA